uniref:Cyclin-L1-1 n=2 Tax=Kalanchoe fedtschenkoi TaxID=63787 RepID=A0A7N0UQD3_KALFE
MGKKNLSIMIYTAIDNFYLTEEQLHNTPSSKDGIDHDTETTLRVYGCDLIQESGILLRLPQAVMATAQVLFHRFYCKKSFARFNVKRVAASSVWLASKLEENPRKARHVLLVFHRMECRREQLPIEHIDPFSKKYSELKNDLNRTERHLLKEMGFICHVEHPHKFICNYLATLETQELSQEAWNLANDSLRTTLCVRFKSEVIACGVVYAAARRFQVPLPENPPWWKAFDAEKHQIDEICRVLAHLYCRPKAHYISVCKDGETFASSRLWDSKSESVPKQPPSEASTNGNATSIHVPLEDKSVETIDSRGAVPLVSDKPKDSKADDDSKSLTVGEEAVDKSASNSKSCLKTEASGERIRDPERERDRYRERDREKSRDRDRGRESDRDREREENDRSRDRIKDKGHRSKSGNSEKSRHHHSSRDREHHGSYPSSREKDRHRHHQYN